MGIPERKDRHRQELRQRILDAAEELFVAEGFQNVSMRKIAEKIEYSPTTVYRLFENKADLMEQLIAEGYRGVYERYQEVLDNRPESPLDTLHQIVIAYAGFALEHPNHYQLWFETGDLRLIDNQLHMSHGGTSYSVYRTWLDLIVECEVNGFLPEGETLIQFQLIWGAVHGMISLRIHHPHFPWLPHEEHVDRLFSVLHRDAER